MHQRRQRKAPRPWLSVRDISRKADVPDDVAAHVVEVMTKSKFGHLDRYQDFVSREILASMRRADTTDRSVAVSIATRYKSSPPGLAKQLTAASPAEFKRSVSSSTNGVAYEQTGLTKEQVASGVLAAATYIAEKAPYANWEALESRIASVMKKRCGGYCLEHFSARQVAADCCRLVGFVKDLARGQRPKLCPLGPGARKGCYFAERAKRFLNPRYKPKQVQKKCVSRRQTGYCEYMKLVRRLNFRTAFLRALYTPRKE